MLLSAHIVSDLENLANKLFILKDCKIILQGSEEDILKNYPLKAYKTSVKDQQEVDKLERKNYLISNVHRNQQGYEVRFLSKDIEQNEYVEDDLKLEDIYYVNFSKDRQDDEI